MILSLSFPVSKDMSSDRKNPPKQSSCREGGGSRQWYKFKFNELCFVVVEDDCCVRELLLKEDVDSVHAVPSCFVFCLCLCRCCNRMAILNRSICAVCRLASSSPISCQSASSVCLAKNRPGGSRLLQMITI